VTNSVQNGVREDEALHRPQLAIEDLSENPAMKVLTGQYTCECVFYSRISDKLPYI